MESIRAVLTSLNHDDQLSQRKVILKAESPVVIGRTPKSAVKKSKVSEDNFYLSSPIVSRKHAVFTTSSTGTLQITDQNSTHGTTVNGVDLMPNTKHTLFVGDTIKFGISIINGNTTHKPPEFRVYSIDTCTIDITSDQRPLLRNNWQFVVPESESSNDDECNGFIEDTAFSYLNATSNLESRLNGESQAMTINSDCSPHNCHSASFGGAHDIKFNKLEPSLTEDEDVTLKSISREEWQKGCESNRSRNLTSLKNILNDSSNPLLATDLNKIEAANNHNIADTLDKTRETIRCDSAHIVTPKSRSSVACEELKNEELLHMSKIFRVSTSPIIDVRENSMSFGLKRKIEETSDDPARKFDEEQRLKKRKVAMAMINHAANKKLELLYAKQPDSKPKWTTRSKNIQFTSAFVGAVLGGIGVFATLASLPDNLFA